GGAVPASASEDVATTEAIHSAAPWARAPVRPARPASSIADGARRWQGDMLVDEHSFAGEHRPSHASSYEYSPGILYVAMEGVTLSPYCTGGDSANAAQNCSPLVDSMHTFPSYGSGQ